jgi:hypothetical protein
MKMSVDDIYSIEKGSLKDAVVQLGGCTAEVISPQGLLLTNHHCGYGQIQSHSTLENNYLEDGFWAASHADELPNPGLTATFVVRMEDVTAQALEGVGPKLTPAERQSLIDQNLDKVKKSAVVEAHENIMIRPFFEGHQYILFVLEIFRDVRLVGAPPSAIGKYGDDTDNWVWPRHSGDFALFRIYAGPDNKPAEYSPDNKPFKPRHFLPISLKGVKEGDFTLVMGFPGRTDSYLPADGVRQVLHVTDPIRVGMRDISLRHIGEAMRQSPETKLRYAAKQSRISNGWKKWIGEMQGLSRTGAVGKKQHMEEQFMEILRDQPALNERYGNLLQDFRDLYTEMEPFHKAQVYYSEALNVNVELFRTAFRLARLERTLSSQGEEAYQTALTSTLSALEGFYKDFDAGLDQTVFAGIMEKYFSDVNTAFLPEEPLARLEALGGDYGAWAKEIYGASALTSLEKLTKLLESEPQKAMQDLQADPFLKLTMQLNGAYTEKVAPAANAFNEQLAELQRDYMLALIEVFPKRRFYPNANSTLRVTFGQVAGYAPRDGVVYRHQTTHKGIMEKYIPGDYEYDLPEKLRNLIRAQDFGPYGVNGELPVNFIGTNHTTGGNSGSPVVDANGALIGLNFDRVWEGTMSDINYDAAICRNIMVDVRYILFVIDKLGGAGHLLKEMKIVR